MHRDNIGTHRQVALWFERWDYDGFKTEEHEVASSFTPVMVLRSRNHVELVFPRFIQGLDSEKATTYGTPVSRTRALELYPTS